MSEDISSGEHPPADRADSVSPTPMPRATDAREHHVLSYLSRFEYPVELRTLAAGVAAEERNIPAETVGDHVRRGVAVALHHVHLPELVAAGLVRYDHESRMAVTTEAIPPTERFVWTIDGVRESDAV